MIKKYGLEMEWGLRDVIYPCFLFLIVVSILYGVRVLQEQMIYNQEYAERMFEKADIMFCVQAEDNLTVK